MLKLFSLFIRLLISANHEGKKLHKNIHYISSQSLGLVESLRLASKFLLSHTNKEIQFVIFLTPILHTIATCVSGAAVSGFWK